MKIRSYLFSAVLVLILICVFSNSAHALPANVLVYDEDSYHQHALTAVGNLGITFTQAGPGDFVTLLESQSWDMVIMENPSNNLSVESQTAVINYISGGGLFIMNYWDLNNEPGLQAALEVATTADEVSDTAQVYPWLPDSLWTTPNALTGLTGDSHGHWADKGDHMSVAGTAVALGGFVSSPNATDAAIILGNSGRTLVIGYLIDDLSNDINTNGKADGVDIVENAITRLSSQPNSQPNVVPTMNEWGMIIFMAVAGLGSVYYLRKYRRV